MLFYSPFDPPWAGIFKDLDVTANGILHSLQKTIKKNYLQ